MYDFGEDCSLSGLLEQLKGAAVAVTGGVVAEYNSAARQVLPDLREGERVTQPEPGVIGLCGLRFEAASYEVGEYTVYTFAVPAQTALDGALPLLENMGRSIVESLNASCVASELIASTAERERLESLERHNAILRHEQHRLLHLAENLRELSALAGGGDVLQPSLFELDELCERIVDTAGAVLAGRGIEVEFSAEGADFMVYADERRIERTLLALLANSVEACQWGGRIALRLKREAGLYSLLLEDNGPGISEERYRDVFESFSRPLEPGSVPGGVGLSLLVARETVLRHGGNFAVQSKTGKGTRVMLTLPANRPKNTALHSSRVEYAANPMRLVLSEFSNILDYKFYTSPYL